MPDLTPAEKLLIKMGLPSLGNLEELDDDKGTGSRPWPLKTVKIRDLREYLLSLKEEDQCP